MKITTKIFIAALSISATLFSSNVKGIEEYEDSDDEELEYKK
jgi:hypothetical protein